MNQNDQSISIGKKEAIYSFGVICSIIENLLILTL